MSVLSLICVVAAHLVYGVGPGFLFPAIPANSPYRLFLVSDPAIRQRAGYLQAAVLALALAGLAVFLVRLFKNSATRKWDRLFVINCVAILSLFPLIRPSLAGARFLLSSFSSPAGVHPVKDLADGTVIYFEGFDLKVPAGFRLHVSGGLEPETAYEQGMPYAYASYVPEELLSGGKFERFELRLGMHLNKERLSAAEFVTRRNSRMEQAVKRLDVFASAEVTIAGRKGIEDAVLVDGPAGKQCLVRVILPYKDKFIAISGLVGAESIIPDYREMFEAISRTAAVSKRKPAKPLKAQKASARKIQLEDF